MNTDTIPMRPAATQPCLHSARVWLAARPPDPTEPRDRPVVRDNMMRIWRPEPDGGYCTSAGRHRCEWVRLRSQFDLVEIRR